MFETRLIDGPPRFVELTDKAAGSSAQLAPDRGGYPAAPMLIIGGFCAYLSVWVIGVGEMALNRQFRRSA